MPTFFLNGKELEFTQGETIIEVAQRAGIEIPHFCWHPSLAYGDARGQLTWVYEPVQQRICWRAGGNAANRRN